MKAAGFYSKCKNYSKSSQRCFKKMLRVTKTMGVYIGPPLCETTRKPNILTDTRDKKVIHQMKSVGINYTRMTRQEILLGRTISLGRENFAR